MSSEAPTSSSISRERDQPVGNDKILSSSETPRALTTTNLQTNEITQLARSDDPAFTPTLDNTESDVEKIAKLRILEAYVRLGDYSGKVYNDLKNTAEKLNLAKPGDCTTWAEAIGEKYYVDRKHFSKKPLTKAFLDAANRLFETSDLPVRASWRAIQHYADRNEALHSKAGNLKFVWAWKDLDLQILQDLKELQDIIPDSFKDNEAGHEEDCIQDHRAIIKYYRASTAKEKADNKLKGTAVDKIKDGSESQASSPGSRTKEENLAELHKAATIVGDLVSHLGSMCPERCQQIMGNLYKMMDETLFNDTSEEERANDFAYREKDVKDREERVRDREETVRDREQTAKTRERTIKTREKSVNRREDRVNKREEAVKNREEAVKYMATLS